MSDDERYEELVGMFRAQQVEIDNLRMQLRLATEDDPHRRPQRFIFLASKSGTTWQERGVSNGAIVDFATGRVVTSAGATGALISRGSDVFLFETQDEHGRRYIEIGGGESSVGQYQGQAHIMVVNNSDGWEFPFLHPVP